MGKDRGDQEQWKFPTIVLSDEDKKKLITAVLKVATQTMFRKHYYNFGGKMYRQSQGGPIGLRGTCVIAHFIM